MNTWERMKMSCTTFDTSGDMQNKQFYIPSTDTTV
jgi:hypothetical protein